MRFLVIIVMLLAGPAFAADFKGIPSSITDGDTIELGNTKIRMFGMDTPEKKQQCERGNSCYPCGIEARDVLIKLVDRKQVVCEPTGARTYGRIVAVCFRDGLNLNLEMVRLGWAVPYWRFLGDVPELEDDFIDAYMEATSEDRGIHKGKFIIPSEWRNRNKRLPCEQ